MTSISVAYELHDIACIHCIWLHQVLSTSCAAQDLRAKLLVEAEQSASDNAAVASRWQGLLYKEVPQDLFTEIEAQRQACEAIIASKDRLITGVHEKGLRAYVMNNT